MVARRWPFVLPQVLALSLAVMLFTIDPRSARAQNGPVVSLGEHNGEYVDVTKCVADCFDAVVGYTTAPYYSGDTPHSLQLVYRSSLARPMGLVNVAAWDTTSVHPVRMSVQLVNLSTNAKITFTNGATEYFFACDSTGGYIACDSTSNRLAVQFDASTLATGAYSYSLVVRSYYSTTSFREKTVPIRVLVENERSSPFGAGWTIAGYQRVNLVGDSVLITEGNGSMAFFRRLSCGGSSCSYASPAGDLTTLTYYIYNNCSPVCIWRWSRRYPDGTKIGFRYDGRMDQIYDAHGNMQQWLYDASNQPVTFRDVAAKDISLGYVNGKLRWIKDPGGRSDSITIDASGNLTQIKDAAGGLPFQGVYDGLHRLSRRTDRRGGAWGIAYDFASKLQADTAPPIGTVHGSGERLVVSYLSLASALLVDPALGLGTSFSNPAPAANGATVRAKVTNARGITTTLVLDRFGQPARIEQPLGRTIRFTIDTLGRHIVDSVPPGHLIRYTWSGANLTQWKDSTTGRTINYTYDPTYNLLTRMWGDVDSVVNVLSSDKTKTDSTHVAGAAAWTHFDCTGSNVRCQWTGPNGFFYWMRTVFFSSSGFRNADSVMTKIDTILVAARTRYQYDGHGQRIRTISPVRDTTWTQYDSLGRVTRTIGPQHDTTSYTYDSLYLTQVRDAKGQVYKVWPNALGWPDSTADPAGKIMRFTYDSGGNVVRVVNRRGQAIAFTYDSLDQLRSRVASADTTTYFTDPQGRYTAVANRESVDTVTFDAAGRPVVEISCSVLASGGAPQCFRDSSVYEVRDLRTKLVVTAPGLWSPHTASYHYDTHMLLDTLTNFTGEEQALTYGGEFHDSTRKFLALNNLTLTYGRPPYSPWVRGSASLSFSDTTLTRLAGLAYSFDSLSRVTKHYHGNIARPDTIRSFAYSAGRLVAYADTAYTWSMDACSLSGRGRLGESCDYSKVQSRSASRTPPGFFYDSVGNRKYDPFQGYADPGNRLRRLDSLRMDYDFDGNLTRKRILKRSDSTQVLRTDSLFWSALGQLDSVRSRDSTGALTVRIAFGYDGLGRQVRQSVPGETTHLLWDGGQLIFKLDTLGSRVAYWTYYPGTQEPQSVAFTTPSSGDTTLYYVTDALRNTVALLKSNGGSYLLMNNQFRYGPFGDSLSATGNGVNVGHLWYKGAYYDGYTGLYRMGVRYYDPDVGRFISEDPLGLAAGINQYTFAGNDPVDGYDPSGTCGFLCAVAVGIFTSFVASEVNNLFSHDLSSGLFEGPCDCEGRPCVALGLGLGDCNRVTGSGGSIVPAIGAIAIGAVITAVSRARHHSAQQGCSNFNPGQCASIRAAHQLLQGSSHQLCRILGDLSGSRLQSGRLVWNPSYQGWGHTFIDYPRQGAAQAGVTELGSRAFEPGELGNTLVHEAWHVFSPNDPTDIGAQLKETTCGREVGF